MNYKTARKLSDRILELVTPYCDIVDSAGSVRREKKK
jgi:hypothetical protein